MRIDISATSNAQNYMQNVRHIWALAPRAHQNVRWVWETSKMLFMFLILGSFVGKGESTRELPIAQWIRKYLMFMEVWKLSISFTMSSQTILMKRHSSHHFPDFLWDLNYCKNISPDSFPTTPDFHAKVGLGVWTAHTLGKPKDII